MLLYKPTNHLDSSDHGLEDWLGRSRARSLPSARPDLPRRADQICLWLDRGTCGVPNRFGASMPGPNGYPKERAATSRRQLEARPTAPARRHRRRRRPWRLAKFKDMRSRSGDARPALHRQARTARDDVKTRCDHAEGVKSFPSAHHPRLLAPHPARRPHRAGRGQRAEDDLAQCSPANRPDDGRVTLAKPLCDHH